jgi:transposase
MRETRDVFGIGLDTVNRWKQKFARTGDLRYPPHKRNFKKLDPEKFKSYVQEHPDAYLSEVGEAFGCCISAIHRAFKRRYIAVQVIVVHR